MLDETVCVDVDGTRYSLLLRPSGLLGPWIGFVVILVKETSGPSVSSGDFSGRRALGPSGDRTLTSFRPLGDRGFDTTEVLLQLVAESA